MKKSLFLGLTLVIFGFNPFFKAQADVSEIKKKEESFEKSISAKRISLRNYNSKKIVVGVVGVPIATYVVYRLFISDWFIPGFSSFSFESLAALFSSVKINFLRSLGYTPVAATPSNYEI